MQSLEEIEHICNQCDIDRADMELQRDEIDTASHPCSKCRYANPIYGISGDMACMRDIKKQRIWIGYGYDGYRYDGDVYLVDEGSTAELEWCDMWEPIS